MWGWMGMMLQKRTKTHQGAERVNLTNPPPQLTVADIFMCSLLRTLVSFLEQRLLWVDWLGFICVLCLYQRTVVVQVPMVLADNTATPSLTAPIISQSASGPRGTPSCHSSRALSDHTKRLMSLLHRHTSAKNTTRKAATSAAAGKKLDAATCQLKCSVLSKYSHVHCSCAGVRQPWISV